MSAALRASAEGVLAANWTGGSTVPSRRQYPHQWGWDAAYIAIGWSSVDHGRAAAELERTTVDLVAGSGMREYYDPLTGEGLGAHDFSWTAAAVIDILRGGD